MPASKRLTIRRAIAYVVVIGVLFLARPAPFYFAIGAAIALLGEALRVWACGHLRKNQAVINTGPYAYVKNPLYLGTFLIMLGFCVAGYDPDAYSRYLLLVALPVFVVIFFGYYMTKKTKIEGDRLRRRFGEEFDRYDRAVPTFIPRLTPYPGRGEGRFNASLVAENSEVPTVFWVLLGLAIIFVKIYVDFP